MCASASASASWSACAPGEPGAFGSVWAWVTPAVRSGSVGARAAPAARSGSASARGCTWVSASARQGRSWASAAATGTVTDSAWASATASSRRVTPSATATESNGGRRRCRTTRAPRIQDLPPGRPRLLRPLSTGCAATVAGAGSWFSLSIRSPTASSRSRSATRPRPAPAERCAGRAQGETDDDQGEGEGEVEPVVAGAGGQRGGTPSGLRRHVGRQRGEPADPFPAVESPLLAESAFGSKIAGNRVSLLPGATCLRTGGDPHRPAATGRTPTCATPTCRAAA